MLTPHSFTCEHRMNPLGVDSPRPRLSWKSSALARNARQSAYQIQVTDDGGAPLWDSGKIASDASVLLPYGGPAPQPRQRCHWQVRVWDEHNAVSIWSEPASWEMGLIDATIWRAQWITPPWKENLKTAQPAPMLRRAFTIKPGRAIARARIHATALGLYELHLNGRRVGEAQLTPGWTSYNKRLQYQTYDVTALLQTGDNALGAMLGDGWYRGHLGFERRRNIYGDTLALLIELHITYADGASEVITSDNKWKASTGAIRMSDLYMGEHYDARLELAGWAAPGFDDAGWRKARLFKHRTDHITAQIGPDVRKIEEIRPIRIFQTPKGETVLDFGQNMVGWVRMRVRSASGKGSGRTITLHHAEVLDAAGNFYTENLRAAQQEIKYTLKAGKEQVYEPRFTFMGFQFLRVTGYPGTPTLDDFTGVVVHSDMPPIGSFACDNKLINQLQHNILWGQKGNFVDVPTDCPQRDERLGWTGDAQAFIGTAAFNLDVSAFFTKWLADLRADQRPDGAVAFVVPDTISRTDGGFSVFAGAGAAAWGDAATMIPWALYRAYGDTGLLQQSYQSMKAWVEFMRGAADRDLVWRKGFQFGDWLDYRGAMSLKPSPVTNDELVGTAYFAHSAELTSRVARALGNNSDAEHYAVLSEGVKAAFCAEFVSPGGRLGPNSQTSYVLALHFDLLPEGERMQAAARLGQIIRDNNYHLTTGFAGTPYLCHVLSRFGQTSVAYELLNQESFPSWLYPVNKGATTIWERWDGIKPDGSFQDASMNSFNHYAYGSIGEWLYRVCAGIESDPAEPGYKHVLIQPQPGGGLTHVRGALETPYGQVSSEWMLTDAGLQLTVKVPANARATVRVPAAALDQVREGGQPVQGAVVDGVAVIEIGSGDYAFASSGLTRAQMMSGVRHVAGRLDRYSTLAEHAANPRSRKLLDKALGAGFFAAPNVGFVMGQPLEALAGMMPQKITAALLAKLEARSACHPERSAAKSRDPNVAL